MEKNPDFDLASAHKYFSAECFNLTWDFIEKLTGRLTMTRRCFYLAWHRSGIGPSARIAPPGTFQWVTGRYHAYIRFCTSLNLQDSMPSSA